MKIPITLSLTKFLLWLHFEIYCVSLRWLKWTTLRGELLLLYPVLAMCLCCISIHIVCNIIFCGHVSPPPTEYHQVRDCFWLTFIAQLPSDLTLQSICWVLNKCLLNSERSDFLFFYSAIIFRNIIKYSSFVFLKILPK